MAVTLSLFMHIYCKRENARRDAQYGPVPEEVLGPNGETLETAINSPEERRRLGLDNMTEAEVAALGDRHPLFRYYS
jgi:hypothetical protein